jgi:hypothetical protein
VSEPQSAEAVRAGDRACGPAVTVDQLRAAVEAHEPANGMTQWYVDELCIDCDADEFWSVIAAVLEKQ